jgi:hypothetical protein
MTIKEAVQKKAISFFCTNLVILYNWELKKIDQILPIAVFNSDARIADLLEHS